MNELRKILSSCRESVRRGEPAVLATVVKTEGSSYRRPGARMLFPAEGKPVGFISGGCLEEDLAQRAEQVLASGDPRTVVYDMRSPDDIVWGLGLGCNGEVRVLLERIDASDPTGWLEILDRCCRERTPAVVVTLFEGDQVGRRLILDADGFSHDDLDRDTPRGELQAAARAARTARRSTVLRLGSGSIPQEALVEYVAPEISLLIFGAGQDAVPLTRMARQLGWIVTVLDHREAYARAENFPDADRVETIEPGSLERAGGTIDDRTAVVVMTHHFLHDLDLLEFLLPSPALYLGCLGPRLRTQNLLRELAGRGVHPDPGQRARLYGPVGLDIGSETPEEIALSALAEVRAVMSGHPGGFLRDRTAPLHGGGS